jgi:predicted regulator of Ras-like GTPase activity (Roadblock/LC7/MglB family)
MPLEGSLNDLSLSSLIQLNCQEMNDVRITLQNRGKEGVIFCSNGNIIHAATGSAIGDEAVFELLRWKTGDFRVVSNVKPPETTINRSWNTILLEGMQRIDEGEKAMEGKYSKLVNELKQTPSVTGVVVVTRDGTILAEAIEGNAEREGAVAVFLGNAADQVGESLALGSFDWGVVSLGQERMLVMERPDFYVGLFLSEKASPALVSTSVEETMKGWS